MRDLCSTPFGIFQASAAQSLCSPQTGKELGQFDQTVFSSWPTTFGYLANYPRLLDQLAAATWPSSGR